MRISLQISIEKCVIMSNDILSGGMTIYSGTGGKRKESTSFFGNHRISVKYLDNFWFSKTNIV